ncbi:hypothetical protein [Xanthobacter versatilis]|uniref:hypothetical protein n=1 Tax=Xanthobacter autotrophicus (strain ATCC BAA-1158 / Py2) TaxID=78245 RepID=UPI003728D0C1
MSGAEMARFGAVVGGDLLSIFVPGSGTLTHIVNKVIERRRERAAEILLQELSSGLHGPVIFDNLDVEPVVAMTLRISRAVSDGTSMRNIRFLAQVVAGLKKNRLLSEDAFLKWSKIVESLTRDELLVVGFAYRATLHRKGGDEREVDTAFRDALTDMCRAAGIDDNERTFLCAAVSRTGLLVPVSAWNGTAYHPSKLLRELGTLIDLTPPFSEEV